MAAIGDLAALLVANGMSADVVGLIVGLAEQHAAEKLADNAKILRSSADVGGLSADSTYDRRKEYDRKRQAEIRRLKRLSEKPPLILTSLSNTSSEETLKEVSKERIRPRASKKRAEPLPDDWKPNIDHHRLAAATGVDIQDVEPRFRDYLKSTGKQYADYDAALRTFIRNTPKFNGSQNHGRRTTVHDAAKDLTRTLRAMEALNEPAPRELRGGEGAGAFRLVSPRRRE